jgi:hypothetical protein
MLRLSWTIAQRSAGGKHAEGVPLMVSGSDRHASIWQQTLDIPGAKDLMLDHADKAMGWLGEAIEGEDSGQTRHCTDAIEEALYEHRKSLFGDLGRLL